MKLQKPGHINEDEYKNLSKITEAVLPSMAVAVVKYNEKGQPYQAKYCIVVLGNLDPNNWSKSDCFAPVMSQLDFRILLSEACRKRCKPKTGDFEQAFCQSFLPNNESYIIRPPKGCFLTPPNTYLLLEKTLYELKRSPRHWYLKATEVLTSLGLHECQNAPCIFRGYLPSHTNPEDKIILDLYVDNFIYFSKSLMI